uniref:mS23 n=1 Tax=Polytomella magna TaxID=353565 RepID=UPI002240E4CD|nr:Chain Bu, mS23 [Polytomella magna]8APN_Bu Chain Bu, mS23 [Polytomella magna]8APO_Bu Chain Bu, mS23 [Polytomella magna]
AFSRYFVQKFKQSYTRKYMRDMESGAFSFPKCHDILGKYRPDVLFAAAAAPLKLELPEQAVYKKLYRDFPELRKDAVDLSSLEAPLAKQFALKHLVLSAEIAANSPRTRHILRRDLEADPAYERLKEEFMPRIAELRKQQEQTASLQQLQADEEEHLKLALTYVAAQ